MITKQPDSIVEKLVEIFRLSYNFHLKFIQSPIQLVFLLLWRLLLLLLLPLLLFFQIANEMYFRKLEKLVKYLIETTEKEKKSLKSASAAATKKDNSMYLT